MKICILSLWRTIFLSLWRTTKLCSVFLSFFSSRSLSFSSVLTPVFLWILSHVYIQTCVIVRTCKYVSIPIIFTLYMSSVDWHTNTQNERTRPQHAHGVFSLYMYIHVQTTTHMMFHIYYARLECFHSVSYTYTHIYNTHLECVRSARIEYLEQGSLYEDAHITRIELAYMKPAYAALSDDRMRTIFQDSSLFLATEHCNGGLLSLWNRLTK